MIAVQGLQRYVLLLRLNVVTELEGFFQEHSHLQFRLVFSMPAITIRLPGPSGNFGPGFPTAAS